ncbi:MAG: hypothetical protein IMZ66_04865 [Planctomycetes bacterium]|nr:hypothetical protein [Planctomycetota bacterium]
MAGCGEMKVGQVYTCGDCGIELKVVKACRPDAHEGAGCCCGDDDEPCALSCCGKELTLKK